MFYYAFNLKQSTMKNLLLIFSFLLFVVNCYTQQFTFNELLLMTNDYKVFELNMIKNLINQLMII